MSNFSLSSDIKINTKIVNQNEKIVVVSGFRRAYGLGVGKNFILIPDFETGLIYQVNIEKNKTKILYRENDKLKYLSFLQKLNKNKLGKEIVQPHDIIIDDKSNIFISEMGPGRGSGKGKISIFDNNFSLIKDLGLEIHNNYGLISPVMINKIEDKYYVSEYGAHKILRFSEKYEYLDWIGEEKEIDKKIKNNSWEISKQFININLSSPHAIKMGPNNNLYIADTDNDRILRFSKSGEFKGWIGKNENGTVNNNWSLDGKSVSGKELGAFNKPLDLVIKGDFLYVTEIENSRIVKVGLDGKNYGWLAIGSNSNHFEWSKDYSNKIDLEHPYGIKIKNNVIYIADRRKNRIKIIYSKNLF